MSYDNTWSDRADAWAAEEWMSLDTFREFITHMEGVKIALSAQRQAALDYYSGLQKDAPFSHDRRMPRYGSYVRLYSGDWPSKIAQMLAALNFKELDQTRAGKERVEQGTRAQLKPSTPGPVTNVGAADSQVVDEPRDSIPNDVLLSYVKSIQNMKLEVSRREGVYGRTKLEDELRITWA